LSVHEGVKYPCNQCDLKFTQHDNLKTHEMSVHRNVKYPCNQRDSKFSQQGNLKIHKMAVVAANKTSSSQKSL